MMDSSVTLLSKASLWEIPSTCFSSWHSCFLTAVIIGLIILFVIHVWRIHQIEVILWTNLLPKVPVPPPACLLKNQSFFSWTSVCKKSFENTLPHQMAFFVKMPLLFHKWLHSFSSQDSASLSNVARISSPWSNLKQDSLGSQFVNTSANSFQEFAVQHIVLWDQLVPVNEVMNHLIRIQSWKTLQWFGNLGILCFSCAWVC